MTELVPVGAEDRPLAIQLALELEAAGSLDSIGLVLDDPELSFERYVALGRYLGSLRDLTAWAIGDWLVFGEAVYGERYAQAVEATGRSKATLQNYAWVAAAIPRSRRRSNLTFSHHRLVAKLPPKEQTKWLDRTEKQGWSVEELSGALAALEAGPNGTEPPASPSASATIEDAARSVLHSAYRDGPYYRVDPEPIERLRAALGEED